MFREVQAISVDEGVRCHMPCHSTIESTFLEQIFSQWQMSLNPGFCCVQNDTWRNAYVSVLCFVSDLEEPKPSRVVLSKNYATPTHALKVWHTHKHSNREVAGFRMLLSSHSLLSMAQHDAARDSVTLHALCQFNTAGFTPGHLQRPILVKTHHHRQLVVWGHPPRDRSGIVESWPGLSMYNLPRCHLSCLVWFVFWWFSFIFAVLHLVFGIFLFSIPCSKALCYHI